jgi:hypothetical protein
LGRPLALNRHEFHPCAEWLLRQGAAGTLHTDQNPTMATVGFDRTGNAIVGRWQPDETRLLSLYREWEASDPASRLGHGEKFNGDVYYGAFRGRTHVDAGSTLVSLFGAGEVIDFRGVPAGKQQSSRLLGGTLMVATPAEDNFTALPYRLPNSSPFVVVFFEEAAKETRNSQSTSLDLGLPPTVHGVRRIEDKQYSRGQAVVHLKINSDHVT